MLIAHRTTSLPLPSRRLWLMAVCLAAAVWLFASPLFPSRPAAAASPNTVVFPAPLTDYLTNPGIGWQEAQDFDNPTLPEAVSFRRPQYAWKNQNPADDVYDWSAVDADLQAAAAEGRQFSFRIYSMRSVSNTGHQVPDWALAKGAVIRSDGEVDYSNCVYQAEWAEFVEAMRQRYDGDPNVAFIDISGYGNYNEWSWRDQTDTDPESLDYQARQRLADVFIGGSGTIECQNAGGGVQTVSYSYPGFQTTQLVMPFAGIQQSSRYVAERRPDVGIRHDCLGSKSHTDTLLEKIGDVIASTWQNAPIIYEFCSNGGTNDPEFIAEADSVLQQTHGSVVHDNTMDGRDPDVLADLLHYAGYRYILREASYPNTSIAGFPMNLGMTWINEGYAPSYPRMGQDYELRVYLTTSNGSVLQSWAVNTNVAGWLPADPWPGDAPEQVVNADLTLRPDLAGGVYSLSLAIVNRQTGESINLAITGRDAYGRYPLGAITVTPSLLTEQVFLPTLIRN